MGCPRMAERNGATELNALVARIEMGDIAANGFLGHVLLGQILENETTRMFTLLFGLAAFSGGIVMMFRHQRSYREANAAADNDRIRLFEYRKFRRRMTASSMISAIGVMMASLYWATEPRVFAVLITLVLVSLLGVLGLAMLDLMSVGLQQISRTDDSARKAMVEEYLKRRKQQAEETESD